jgi:hypothetical protein
VAKQIPANFFSFCATLFNNYEADQSLGLRAAGCKHLLLCYDEPFLAVMISYFPV